MRLRRESLVALLGDFIGLHNSPVYKPPPSPAAVAEEEDRQLRRQHQLAKAKKDRPSSMYEGDLPSNSAEQFRQRQQGRRQSEPAIKHVPKGLRAKSAGNRRQSISSNETAISEEEEYVTSTDGKVAITVLPAPATTSSASSSRRATLSAVDYGRKPPQMQRLQQQRRGSSAVDALRRGSTADGGKGGRRGSETLLGSFAVFSKPLVPAINSRM